MAKAASDKAIISCAIAGAVHTPTMSDALPYKPDDIAAQAIAAAEAGAAILLFPLADRCKGGDQVGFFWRGRG